MRRRRGARIVCSVALLVGAVGLIGCEDQKAETAAERPPALGAPAPRPTAPADPVMDEVERPIAERLATQVRDEGLTLEHIDCPRWKGRLPAQMRCDGYVDGVVGEVRVELSRGAGGGVEYDAWLEGGVVSTQSLVERLQAEGFDDVDCGHVPAYPAKRGLRLVCEVHRSDAASYVVAVVTDRSGAVRIKDY